MLKNSKDSRLLMTTRVVSEHTYAWLSRVTTFEHLNVGPKIIPTNHISCAVFHKSAYSNYCQCQCSQKYTRRCSCISSRLKIFKIKNLWISFLGFTRLVQKCDTRGMNGYRVTTIKGARDKFRRIWIIIISLHFNGLSSLASLVLAVQSKACPCDLCFRALVSKVPWAPSRALGYQPSKKALSAAVRLWWH